MSLPEKKNNEIQKGEGFPQLLHDRARKAGDELLKLLISISTAIFSIQFFSITTSQTKYSHEQKLVIIFSMTSMGIAIFSGIISWYSNARKNFFWATALQQTDRKKKAEYYKLKDKWFKLTRLNQLLFTIVFTVGIILATVSTLLILFR